MCDICCLSENDFDDLVRWSFTCPSCQVVTCSECNKDWTLQQIKSMHVPASQALVTFTPSVLCSKEGCNRKTLVSNLGEILQSHDFDQVEIALTRKLLQNSPDGFIACPNPKCDNIGFSDNGCSDSYQCTACDYEWNQSTNCGQSGWD
jgi:hypothetical protein